jgi:lysophospholipase L1-like esterase
MGDSIGEGVQSADASRRTQPASYLNWIAFQMGAPFPLPLIRSGPLGVVGDTKLRSRVSPFVAGANLAVSGADLDDLLNDGADADTPGDIDSETDLVLFPRKGSQMDIVERIDPAPEFVFCWIGNNDVLGSVTSFDELDGSQLTPVEDFRTRFEEIASRLSLTGSRVVYGNIPDVTRIAFLLDREDLIRFLGSDLGLPEGHRTSLVAMLLIRLGLADPGLIQNASWVLDASEIASIQDRVRVFNDIIAGEAARAGAAVADVHERFEELVANPPVFLGVEINHRFLGGLFSLDAVHPSNTAHAIIANEFIDATNATHGAGVPRLSPLDLTLTFLRDPHIDKDGDGRVRGRPLAGLLETLAPFFGFSGDLDDFLFDPFASKVTPGAVHDALERYRRERGAPDMNAEEALRRALEDVFRPAR